MRLCFLSLSPSYPHLIQLPYPFVLQQPLLPPIPLLDHPAAQLWVTFQFQRDSTFTMCLQVANQPLVHFIPSMLLSAPDETYGLQPLNPVMRQFSFPIHLALGHNPSGQPEVLGPAVRHVAMAVSLSELDVFAITALPSVIVPVKLESQIPEPLDPLLVQQALPVPFPLVTDPFAPVPGSTCRTRLRCSGRYRP